MPPFLRAKPRSVAILRYSTEEFAAISLAFIFASSAFLKAYAPSESMAFIAAMGVNLSAWGVAAISLLELLLALILISGAWRITCWLFTIGCLAAFTAVLWRAKLVGVEQSCGCFGGIVSFTPEESLTRNGVLLVIAGIGLFSSSVLHSTSFHKEVPHA